MDQSVRLLFDLLSDALLLVSSTGVVLYANPAAQEIMPTTLGKPLSSDWLRSQITAVQRGYLKTPLTFDIDLSHDAECTDQVQVTLLPSPARSNFIVVMKSVNAKRLHANELGNLSEMLHTEIRAPMQQFLGSVAEMLSLFEQYDEQNWTLRNAVANVSRRSDNLVLRLRKISLLAATSKISPMSGEERIPLSEMVGDALFSIKTLLAERGIQFSYCGLEDRLPVVYGSRLFLTQALACYIRYLVERVSRGINILISAKLTSNSVLLSITNYGNLTPAQGVVTKLPATDSNSLRLLEAPDLTLALCKRVIKLNGGSLHFHREVGKTKEIVIEFPIGAPLSEHRELETQQTLRYAQDLNTLMQLMPHHFSNNNSNGAPLL
jgi:signal transduction histidine kinase